MILHRRARPRFLVAWVLITTVLAAALAPIAAAESITICHSTGSPSAPWVFLMIDDTAWTEHQAHGDFRAASLAECRASTPTVVAQQALLGPPLQQQPPATPAATATAQPTVAQPTATQPPATPVVTATPGITRTPTPNPTTMPTSSPTAVRSVEVAGATVLPPSGEPVPPIAPLFGLFFALGGVGLVLRVAGRLHR